MIRNSKVIKFENNCLTIKLQQSFGFFFEKLKEPAQIDLLKSYIKNEFNNDYSIHFDNNEDSPNKTEEESSKAIENELVKPKEESKQSKSINNIVSMFDGSVL